MPIQLIADALKSEALGTFLFKYRGAIPTLVLLLILIAHYTFIDDLNPDSYFLTQSYYFINLTVAVTGLIIRGITVGQSPKGTSGRNTNNQLATSLNTTGMYAITRNPLYFGNFLIWTPIAFLSGDFIIALGFLLFFVLFYTMIIRVESQFLEKKFGDKYIIWTKQTPVFLPKLKAYRPSVRDFNWRKILRKEKNGIAATFTVFLIFRLAIPTRIMQMSITEGVLHEWPWSLLALFGIIFYCTVKLIMRFTPLLDNKPVK